MRLSLLALPSMSRKPHVVATHLAIDEKRRKVLLRFGTGPYKRLPTLLRIKSNEVKLEIFEQEIELPGRVRLV